MALTFKLSFEHFDFNEEKFLNDLKHVFHFYNNFDVLEYKQKKTNDIKRIGKTWRRNTNVDDDNIQCGNLIEYNQDIPTLKLNSKKKNYKIVNFTSIFCNDGK